MTTSTEPLASPAKAAPNTSRLQARKVRLAGAMAITFFPVLMWAVWDLVFGNDFIEKHAWSYHLDPVQIYVWLLIAAGLLQLIAVFHLRKSDQKPRDWVAIASLIDAGLSIAFTLFFWMQISALIFRST